MLVPATTHKIEIICPICKTRDLIGVPQRELNKSTRLTTISIHKDLICPHHFQVFVDKNLQIRGYQKVDFELSDENSKKLRNGIKVFHQNEKEEKEVFKNLEIDNHILKSMDPKKKVEENKPNVKKKSLKEIYNEFWEFIEEDNKVFQEFILNDKRRQENLNSLNFNEIYNYLELDQEI